MEDASYADPASDNDNGLDNVVLIDLGPVVGVPEPSTLLLLASGLVGLGGLPGDGAIAASCVHSRGSSALVVFVGAYPLKLR